MSKKRKPDEQDINPRPLKGIVCALWSRNHHKPFFYGDVFRNRRKRNSILEEIEDEMNHQRSKPIQSMDISPEYYPLMMDKDAEVIIIEDQIEIDQKESKQHIENLVDQYADFFEGQVLCLKDEQKDEKIEEKQSFDCEHCESKYSRKEYLTQHILSKHERIKPFTCDKCDAKFSQKGHLKQHVLVVHDKNKSFVCEECKSKFSGKGDLNRHVSAVHKKEKPFTCNQCVYTSSYKQHLLQHILAIHDKKKPFACTRCDSKFVEKGKLTKHVSAVHDKQKPFACDQCESKFSEKQSLRQHVLAIHRQEKPFACNQCEYKCSIKQNLIQHVSAVHQGKRPFICDQCEHKCSQKGDLKKHQKSKHPPEGQSRQKHKENRFYREVKKTGEIIDMKQHYVDMRCVQGTWALLDGVIYKETFVCILECNEFQHNHYASVACDVSRANKICAALLAGGETRPVLICNFNPDSFQIDGVTNPNKIKYEQRIQTLVKYINEPANTPTQPLTMVYFYYDIEDNQLAILNDPEFPVEMKECVKFIY